MGRTIRFVIQTSYIIKPARVRVVIHDDVVGLQEETDTNDTGGLCQRYHIDGRKLEDNPTLATIHLHRQGLRTGVIAHEATHAALHIFELGKLGPISTEESANEEVFCYTVGDLISKIVQGLYKRRLLTAGKPVMRSK